MIDVSPLLQPIAPDRPAGSDLRQDGRDDVFTSVRELRRQDDPALIPEGVPAKEADFRKALELCERALRERTKDLELAAYLAEAWTRLHGLDGLAAGLQLMDGLIERYWPQLTPGLDQDGGRIEILPEIRAKWIGWLGSSRDFLDAVRAVQLTDGQAELTLLDYENAQRMADAQRTNVVLYDELARSGRTTPEQWERAFSATGPGLREQQAAACARCLAGLDRLETRCQEVLGYDDAPSFARLRELLELVRDLFAGTAAIDAAPAAGAGAAAPAVAGAGSGAGQPLRTRQDAVRTLQDIARFLRSSEPHSPVPFLIERCVRWLNMGFEEVMQDLVESRDIMANVRKTLGMPEPAEE